MVYRLQNRQASSVAPPEFLHFFPLEKSPVCFTVNLKRVRHSDISALKKCTYAFELDSNELQE